MDQKTRSNRALGKQNREQLSEESRFHKSREIAENLMATAVWKQAKQVLLYASYGSEVSTGLLIDAALAAGKEVFLPKVLGDQMEFFRITDRAELAPGYQHMLSFRSQKFFNFLSGRPKTVILDGAKPSR